jgi:hypothetical protein
MRLSPFQFIPCLCLFYNWDISIARFTRGESPKDWSAEPRLKDLLVLDCLTHTTLSCET